MGLLWGPNIGTGSGQVDVEIATSDRSSNWICGGSHDFPRYMGPVWLWGWKIFSNPTTKQGHGEVLEKDPIFF